MKRDLIEAIGQCFVALLVFILIILFAGEPDLMDSIRERITQTEDTQNEI